MSNSTSLYSTTSSGNATVPANNNTSLYNATGVPQVVNNNINVTGNITAGGFISAVGNVTGNYIIGNGSLLTNINANSIVGGYGNANVVTLLSNFGSNVVVTTGNITGGYILGNGSQLTGLPATYSNANVVSLMANFGSNTISTTGNISGGYILGNGSQLTGLPATYGNAEVAAFLPTYTGNLAGGNLAVANNSTMGGNLSVAGTIFGTFAGNISGNLVVPGANTDVIFNNSGNAGASSNFQFDSATNTLELNGQANATGNITASYFLGNGSQLTGLPESYGNANVAAYLPTYTGNIAAGNLTAATTNLTGNANVAGNINMTKGGGSEVSIGSNLNDIRIYGAAGTGKLILANPLGMNMANIDMMASRINMSVSTQVNIDGSLNVTGNITGANIIGNGQFLTNLPGANVTGQVANALVAGTVYTAAQPNITSVGNLTSLTVAGDSLLQGNLQVNGNVTYIASNTVVINDKFINVANNAATASQANGGGIGVGPAGAEYATWSFSDANTAWQSNIKIEAPAVTTTGNVTANYFIGDGSQLTNINAGNIVGAYGTANVATFLGTGFGSNTITTTGNITAGNIIGDGQFLTNLTGANVTGSVAQANIANTANSVAGANVSGQVANALVAGTVYTNAQPNITSVGTLTSLSVTGNVTAGNVNTNAVQATGSGGLALKNSAGTTQASLGAGGGDNFAISVSTNLNGNNAQIDISPTGTGHVHIKPTGTGAVEIAPTNTGSINNMVIGNVTPRAANVTTLGTTGNITAAGILTDGYYYANGTPVSFGGTYGNANVATFLANFGSNTVSTTGNVTANYFLGNGSQLTGITTTLAGNLAGNINTLGFSILSTSGPVKLSDDVEVTGNLQLGGYIYNSASTNKVVTANGNADISTSVVKFGSGSLSLDGSIAQYVSTPVTTDFQMGTGDFTIEMFWYPINLTTTAHLFDIGVLGSAFDYRPSLITRTGNVFYSGYNYIDDITGTTQITANAWNHIAVAKSSGNTKLFLNGTQIGNTFADSYNYIDGSGGQVRVGTTTYDNASASVSGFIDEIRVLKGQAAYTANFTPPTGPFTANANTVLLLHCDGSSGSTVFFDSSTVNDVTVDDNLVVTGDVTSSGYFVGDGSQLTGIVTTPGNTFSTISANGTSIVADSSSDTLTFAAGSGISILGNATTDTITITATGGGGTYGDANVNTLLASWGSNTLSTTGNVSVGNLNMTGQVFDASGVLQLNAVGNIVLVPTGSVEISGPTVITGGQLTTGAVTYANTDGTVGQVLTTYGNGVTYFSTVSGGSGSPGGANTQIQFNDGGAFAGNAAMTFDKVTGNITLGNIVTNVNKIQTVASINVSAVTANGISTPYRILVGNGYVDGTVNSAYATFNAGQIGTTLNSSRLLSADFVSIPNNGSRYIQNSNFTWAALTANASNTNTRVNSTRSELTVGGGANNFAYTATVMNGLVAQSAQITLGRGTNANLSAVGNIAVTGAVAGFSGVQVQPGSSATIAVGHQALVTPSTDFTGSTPSNYGNITNMVGFYAVSSQGIGNTQLTPTTSYTSYYHPGTSNSLGLSYTNNMGNTARNAPNYFAFRCDDDLAQSRLGMLSRFHELNANTANTSGTVDISKNSGQVQTIYPTGNVTIGSFTNFVTRVQAPSGTQVNAADTVTLIIQQGATPYTVTMPTGNTQIRYAAGVSTVPATANTTVMISITGVYDYSAAGNEYLITISPEFS